MTLERTWSKQKNERNCEEERRKCAYEDVPKWNVGATADRNRGERHSHRKTKTYRHDHAEKIIETNIDLNRQTEWKNNMVARNTRFEIRGNSLRTATERRPAASPSWPADCATTSTTCAAIARLVSAATARRRTAPLWSRQSSSATRSPRGSSSPCCSWCNSELSDVRMQKAPCV